MTGAKDYYKTLGVREDAGLADIKKAYRDLAKKYHPDANAGNKQAEERFKEISEAYNVLGNSKKRQQYDQMRRFGGGAGGFDPRGFDFSQFRGRGGGQFSGGSPFGSGDIFGNLGDLFSQIFDFGPRSGPRSRRPARGEDIYVTLTVPFETAVRGGKTTFAIEKEKVCPVCQGGGARPGSRVSPCPDCGGLGSVTVSQGGFGISRPCPRCYGRGRIIENPCDRCGGTGNVHGRRSYQVTIPAGIENGEQIRLKGEGRPGTGGRKAGDIIVQVQTGHHRFFERTGNDIHCRIELNLAQAVLGTKIRVKTIHGKKVELKIPQATQDGAVFRLPGMGVESQGKKGDQYVHVKVKIPEHLSEEEKELMSRYAKQSGMKH